MPLDRDNPLTGYTVLMTVSKIRIIWLIECEMVVWKDLGLYYLLYSSTQHSQDKAVSTLKKPQRDALNAESSSCNLYRMETSTTDVSRVSWIHQSNMARTLRDAHCAPVPPQSVLIRTRTASPGGCFLPIPCVHSKHHKDTSLLPSLVMKLSKSISARAKKVRSPDAQSHKKKSFSGLRKVLSKASKLLLGRKTSSIPEAQEWNEQEIIEPASRVLCLPGAIEGPNFLIQSTMESWCGHPLPEPGML